MLSRIYTMLFMYSVIKRSISSKVLNSPCNLHILKNVIFFDGVCNFCNKGVDTVISLDKKKQFKFASLQSNYGRDVQKSLGRNPDEISSFIYVKEWTDDKKFVYFKSDAALLIAQELGFPSIVINVLKSVIPLSIRDSAYDFIAFNRYRLLGKRDTCRIGTKEEAERFLE
jgi:predicted DCC family thiol-disulfide oxidoreductase YuxK